MKTKTCKNCNNEFTRKNAREYCIGCSAIKSKEASTKAKKKWQSEKAQAHKKGAYTRLRAAGKERSADIEIGEYDPNTAHGIKLVLAFTRDFSKNKMVVWNGRIMRKRETNDAKEQLTWEVAATNHTFYQGKVWLDICIYQPTHTGDALNYLDVMADAVADAIGVDDRWFSVRRIDWQIDKADPRIVLVVTQCVTEHHAICQTCGAQTPVKNFSEKVQARILKALEFGGHSGTKVCPLCKAK